MLHFSEINTSPGLMAVTRPSELTVAMLLSNERQVTSKLLAIPSNRCLKLIPLPGLATVPQTRIGGSECYRWLQQLALAGHAYGRRRNGCVFAPERQESTL